MAVEHDFFVICDDTYDFLVYDEQPHFSLASIPELKDRIVAAFSFSKKYAMTGWRVGYVWTSGELLDHIMKVHDAVAICAPTLSQHAALAALEGPQDCVGLMRSTLGERRDLVCGRLDRMEEFFSYVKPRGAYYMMIRYLESRVDSMTFALQLLHEARVITIPGAAFGPAGENHVRISFGGTETELEEAFDRIERWIEGRPFQK